MQYYNDKSNDNAAKVLFLFFQMLMTLVVYGFVYPSFVAVNMAVVKYDLTFMTYLPEVISLLGYPVVAWKALKMFKQEKRLRAIVWMVAWASVIIVALYAHLSQLIVT